MVPKRTPLMLQIWMLASWCLAYPIVFLSRVLHRRMGADPKRFTERLGYQAAPSSNEVIWFHAASLGEVMQIGPLAQHLAQAEKTKILVTTTTAAGADWVARNMPDALHRFVPIETPSAVRRFLNTWAISAAIFVEGDLGPRLVMGLRKRGVPQILLNARHSQTRARFPAVFGFLLGQFSLITCRSRSVAQDLSALGLPDELIHVVPDLRLTLPKLSAPAAVTDALSDAIGARPLWLAGSTHPADEGAVLAAHLEVVNAHPNALLIIAPRHPYRGEPLHQLANDQGFEVARRSLGDEISTNTQIYIADTLGEIGAFFALSPITFLGGSFGTEGGHNPYEPASFGSAILYGPRVKNFAGAYAALGEAGAALKIGEPAGLGTAVLNHLGEDKASKMARAGLDYMAQTQDCLSTYLDLVERALATKRA